ncbi:hypothetical protein [Novosphingobium album (ex Hu et al. 2023)]|uniref:Cytochrome C n=1 Tax=Novosphingobium album (ex Hu et al. 2023) TaxID=2930093 RepID=A0ABT0B0A0_9SPHN|nr:hypothetical protein [Novosphingobium album (ex Hu et al. 2023)]MCJ2178492.1 hypothetical protein [Novosphingobium album (ex Hu et al. 2023)]
MDRPFSSGMPPIQHGTKPGSGIRPFAPLAMPFALGLVLLVVPARRAAAVPAFAEQTGMACEACHVGGFGPQLTPLGREFKLSGYTMRAKAFNVPLSAMAVASLTHVRKDQVPPPDGLDRNDNLAFDQGSLFVAGGVGKHLGSFAQITYDGVAEAWAWDNLDVRAVTRGKLFGTDAVYGLTLNNSPTVQDVWNTTPAWGFPYTDTAVSGTPDAAPLIDDALAQNTLGLSAYAWVGQKYYAEAGAYTSPAAGTLNWLGADPGDPGDIRGLAPYGRFAWQGQAAGGTLQAGAFALKAAISPGRDRSTSLRDHYTDLGLDTSWQKVLSSGDTISVQARYVHETSNLQASCALALVGDGLAPDCAHDHLNEWRGDVSYAWHNGIDATLGAFATAGTRNGDLYGGNGKPDSNGLMAELDYSPWGNGNSPLGSRFNMRVGLQCTVYGRFDGARHNYDGAGANASDNDAVRLYTWLAF